MSILFLLLILLQVLIFNHIMLFNVAVPFVFIYFIVRLPIGMSKSLLFTLSFLLGFLVDIFSDTPGLNSLACVLTAAAKDLVFYAYVTKDDKTKFIIPCITSIGWQDYLKYMVTLTAIFCLICFSIEFFSFANMMDILIFSLGSTFVTSLLNYGLDNIMNIKSL